MANNIQNLLGIINIFTYLNDTIKVKINKETIRISNDMIKNIVCPIGNLPDLSKITLEKYKDNNFTVSKNDIDEICNNISDKLKASSIQNKTQLNKTDDEINNAINKLKNNENLLLLFENFTNQIETMKNLNDSNLLESVFCPLYNRSLIPIIENKTTNIQIIYISINFIAYLVNIYTSLLNNIPISPIYGDENLINTLLIKPTIVNLIKKPISIYIQNYLETKINDANKTKINIDNSAINSIKCRSGVNINIVKNLTKVDDILFLTNNITKFNYKTLVNSCLLSVEQNINKNIDDPIFVSFFKSKIEKEKTIKNAKKILYNLNDDIINKLYSEFQASITNHNSITSTILQDILCSNLVDLNKDTQNIQALAVAGLCANSLTKIILQIGLDIYKNPPEEISDADICKKEFDTYKNSMDSDYTLVRKKLDECNIDKSKYEFELKNTKEQKGNDPFYMILLSSSLLFIIILIGITIFLGYKLYKNKNIPLPKKD